MLDYERTKSNELPQPIAALVDFDEVFGFEIKIPSVVPSR